MEELLSLKWNNHVSSFLSVLAKLRAKDQYTDVTLACDGRLFNAHKIVLSTCSDFFATIFEQMTDRNLVIYLKDIKSDDLESLLDYMYLGEVNVKQSELASLIKVAECLQLKGLAVPDGEQEAEKEKNPSSKRQGDHSQKPRKRRKVITPTFEPSIESSESCVDSVNTPIGKVEVESSNNNFSEVKKEVDIVIEDFECDPNLTEQNDSFQYTDETSDTHKVEDTENSQPGTSFQSDSQMWKNVQPDESGKGGIFPFSYPEEDSPQTTEGQSMNELGDEDPLDMQDLPSNIDTTNSASKADDDDYLPATGGGWTLEQVQSITPQNATVCTICSKAFRYAGDLKRHIIIHSNEKPFKCPFCSHSSNRKDHMKQHIICTHQNIHTTDMNLFIERAKEYFSREKSKRRN